MPALEEREEFSLDGVLYEAFNTSGGLGTLAETLSGKVRTLNYRTIRYPGHAAIMKALLNDLRLRDRREVLKDILEQAVPATLQDDGGDLRHGGRVEGRPPAAGHLRAQDLQPAAARRAAQRDPGHDGEQPGGDARPAGPGAGCRRPVSCARRTWRSATSSAIASGRVYRRRWRVPLDGGRAASALA